MDPTPRQIATRIYLRQRSHRRLIASITITLLCASVIVSHAGVSGRCGDDWLQFNHQTFRVIRAESDDSLQISISKNSTRTVRLLGIVAGDLKALAWLNDRVTGRDVTLLLPSPQTQDSSGRLLAFAFIDNSDLSVEMVKAGLAFADRREKTIMDGLIDPAESEARKKKRGLWADFKADQMPDWRKAWLRNLPGKAR